MQTSITDIAIIGIAGRFPGARDIHELWRNLCSGVESIRHFRTDELEDGIQGLASAPNYVRARAIIDDADKFDAAFFGIYPKEAELIDPQQRIFLECCWHAFEDAGYDPQRCDATVGIYAGCSPSTYFLRNLCAQPGFVGEYTAGYQVSNVAMMLGSNFEFLPTRVAYKLNLRGPAFSLNCGCSTSLVAVCQACLSLQNYQCDMALAGGVSVTFPQRRGYLHEPGGMVSSDGHCRTFDEAAQGTVFGDGAGVVLLKRFEDALTDGDHVYGVIKGFGVTNDGGGRVGFTAPGVDGQVRAIAMAHAAAGIDPASIRYIEAHGTGTPLGDPIEIEALTRAFRRHTAAKQFCAIGAVKTNVGHLDVAAGVTGLIKTVLCLHHKMLPPTLNFVRPNPALKLEDSPFYVNDALSPWPRGAQPLRAGVSAFGMGGTNAHVVLEEAPELASFERGGRAHLLVLSAKTEAAVDAISANLGNELARNPQVDLADAAWTLMSGRRCFDVRRILVAKDSVDAAAALSSKDPKRLVTRSGRPERPSVAFMFPGQGTQYAGMGRRLCSIDSYFREQMETCLETLESVSDIDLRRLLLADNLADAGEAIDDTLFAQPALFIVEYALARFWMHLDLSPSGLIGHSVGEFVAACLAGVFSLEDGLRLICERGRMMHGLPRGSMLSVRLSETQLAEFLRPGLDVAAINGPALAVVAGPDDAVSDLEQRLDAAGGVHRRLRTSHAFHSGMMEPVVGPFRELAGRLALKPPVIPFVSSVTGDWISAEEATSPQYWARHLRSPVRFSDGVRKLRATDWALLEVGPGNTLSMLARQHQSEYPEQPIVSSLPDKSLGQTDEAAILNAVGQLWTYGINPDWSRLYRDEKKRRVALPVYPFERRRFWFQSRTAEPGLHPRVDVNGEMSGVRGEETAPGQVNATLAVMEKALGAQSQPVPDEQPGGGYVPTVNTMEAALQNRKGQVRSALEAIFTDLSGMDMSSVAPSATFLEMGFDSLFLTQVSQALQTKFGLKIKFRQLVDQLSDLSSLTDYVQEHIPPTAMQAPLPAPASQPSPSLPPQTAQPPADGAAAALSAEGQAPSTITGMGNGTVEDLCKLQLQTLSEVMAKQLDMLRDAGRATGRDASAKASNAQPTQVQAPSAQPFASAAQSKESELQASPRFKPLIQTGGSADLTAEQQGHLDVLIERYNQRTGGSKRMTQRHRAQLADPRVAAGLRPQWKELVYPIVTVRSKGSRVWDVDGNEYIDLVNGYGPIMLGHAPDFVTAAVEEQLKAGFETGPQSPLAGKVAELICEMTGAQRAAFCNTGSEAVMAAFRLARTVTGRNKIVLFSGAYHGMFDEVLVKGVKGASGPRSLPVAPGIPREKVENVIVLDYGTAESLRYIEAHAAELAAVIVEPVQSRHPELQPIEFLKQLRTVTESSGTAFIFDEVVTGFRVHPGGAQALFGIKADLATYGKVLGGGLPIGVVAGKAAFMDALDGGMWSYGDNSYPETGVTFFAGTFVRHPLALAAAFAVLNHLKNAGPELQERLNSRTSAMVTQLNRTLKERQLPLEVEHFGSISYFGFPAEYRLASLFYYYMREKGVYIQEGFPLFLTTAHSDDDISQVVQAFGESLVEMQAARFLPATPVIDSVQTANATLPAYTNGVDHQPLSQWQTQSKREHSVNAGNAPATGARAPLTESQLEIWLSACLSDEASCAYNESFTLKLQGNLNRTALLAAIDRVIARHEALRITIGPEGDFQEFSPELKLEVPIEDLSALDDASRSNRLAELIGDDARLPFNLTKGPLVRAKLIGLAPEEHHLVFTTHHIVCDGWSTNVILDELSKLYNALVAAGECELPTPMEFGAYARLQAEHFSSTEGITNETYWLEQFRHVPPPLDLPLDRPRPPVKSYDGATFRRVIPAPTYRNIKQFAAKQKCTLFVALLAGFEALLSRLSGQQDIVVGIPAAGQSLLEDEALVGHCVNFLPLRGQFETGATMAAFLDQVKHALLDAYDHQNYTYGRLVRRLSIPRDPSRLPLIEVQFNLERVGAGVEFTGLRIEVDPNPKAFVNHDLFLNVIESEDGLILDCDYNSQLFDEPTVARWLGHYETLLLAMTSDSNRPISALPLLSDQEIGQIVVDWNDNRAEYPRDLGVHQLFENQARLTPDAIAAVYQDQQLTYSELNRKANQLAAHLGELGVGSGSLVGVFVERSLDMIVALLGVLKSGGAYIPMDPTYPVKRIAYVLNEAKVPVLLTQSALAGTLPGSSHVVCLDTDWNTIAASNDIERNVTVSSEELAYVIYTSGSTGDPKGVEIPHRAVVNLLTAMSKAPGLQPSDILMAVTTLSFDIAALELFLPLCVGARLVIASRQMASDGGLLIKGLESTQTTVLQATPITFRLLIEAGWDGKPKLKILCGGEAIPRDLANQLVERSTSVWNMYGPTETTIWSSTIQIEQGDGPVPIGPPIDNTQFYVLDETGQLAPIGRPGELHIGGEGLARGYFRRPELTADKFVRDPFDGKGGGWLYKTGDLVRRLPAGIFEFLGRLDNQVKLRGFRIELGEIESALAQYPGVREAVVTLREDVPGEKRLVAYMVVEQQELTVMAVRDFLIGKLPDYMLPSAVVRVDSIPRTPNGKTDRRALPAPQPPPEGQSKEYVAPETADEKTMANIWGEVLHLTRVGVTDNLFELGADSLHMFQIAARAGKAGIRIAPAQFLKYRTIAELLTYARDVAPENKPVLPGITAVARERYRINRSAL